MRSIGGIVYDNSREPVIGASVSLAGNKSNATVTDADGQYEIHNVADGDTLTVAFVGYSPAKVPILPGKDRYNITLVPVQSQLDEVVVVGYSTQRKVNMTGAVSSIGPSTLADRPLTNVTNALAGVAPGLTVTN